MLVETLYPWLKLLHLTSLIFCLGPTLAAWWMLRLGNRQFGEPGFASQYLYLLFFKLVQVEHLAFASLLGSGIGMALLTQGLAQHWLVLKLTLLSVIVLPIEILDIWFGNIQLPRLFKQRHPVRPYSRQEQQLLGMYHQRLVPIALVVLPPTLLVIFWLAISKPALF